MHCNKILILLEKQLRGFQNNPFITKQVMIVINFDYLKTYLEPRFAVSRHLTQMALPAGVADCTLCGKGTYQTGTGQYYAGRFVSINYYKAIE